MTGVDYTGRYLGGHWSEPQYTKAALMASYYGRERLACLQFSLKPRYEDL